MDEIEIFRKKFNTVVHNVKIEVKHEQDQYTKPDQPKESLQNWLNYIQKHLDLAKYHLERDEEKLALDEVLKVTGVSFNTLMAQETVQ